jgi:hypothetical protein
MVTVHWTARRVAHLATRSERYPDALDIELAWVAEAAADPNVVIQEPDPKSNVGAVRIVGFSPSAGFVVTIVARRIDGELWGDSAWKTTGAERRRYKEARDAEAE